MKGHIQIGKELTILSNARSPITHSIYHADLKEKMHENIEAVNAKIIRRTQVRNAKSSYSTLEEEQGARETIMSAQIKV